MTPIDAVTHHNPHFLKSAYRNGDFIKLHNTADTIRCLRKYIVFDPATERYRVLKKTGDKHPTIGLFDNIESAMFYIRK